MSWNKSNEVQINEWLVWVWICRTMMTTENKWQCNVHHIRSYIPFPYLWLPREQNITKVSRSCFQYCLFMHLETLLLCILYCGSHYELTLAPLLNFSRQNFWPWHQSLYYFYQIELSSLIEIHSCRGLPRSTVHWWCLRRGLGRLSIRIFARCHCQWG